MTMTAKEATDFVSRMDCGGKPVKMVDHARMTGDVLIIITEDTIKKADLPALPQDVTTRRLSIFVGCERQAGIIL